MNARTRRILIVAGEPSADRYGAGLVRKLRPLMGGCELEFFGAGGDAMEGEGVRLLCHVRDLASIGPREALTQLGRYLAVFRQIVAECDRRRPDLALLLDFPDFNLRLAKKLKRRDIKVIYYISPQLWAWRRGRVRVVRNCVEKMLVILPFEESFYREQGVDAEFVGHPLLEDFGPAAQSGGSARRRELDPGRRTVALLPGSRRKEVSYILPTMLQAARRIQERVPTQFLVSVAPTLRREQLQRIAADVLGPEFAAQHIHLSGDDVRALLAASDFAMVKSGTSTLEAALVGTPFLVLYKISPASWLAGRLLISTPFKGLVNLIAQEAVVPEFLQSDATPEALSEVTLEYLGSTEKSAAMRSRLAGIRGMLSTRCASDMAAAAVKSYLWE